MKRVKKCRLPRIGAKDKPYRRKKGNWGTWEQRMWKIQDGSHPFNN